jgi:NAD(P)-dependent dehydrogenase (short-subunit alcohol dehydrogenase family)
MKWAVITGSSSGLGLAMTSYLLEQGWCVAGGSRSGTDIEDENFFDLELDVTDSEAVDEFYRTLKELTPKVHLFIQNAGVCEMNPISKTDVENFGMHLATNTLGAFLMLQGLKPFLIEGESHIISLLSTASKFGYPEMAAYNASKFGQRGMLESIQKEWKNLRLRFTPLYSGAVDTPLWGNLNSEFSNERMLSVEEFLYVFDFVVNAPKNLRLADLTFIHREGFLE